MMQNLMSVYVTFICKILIERLRFLTCTGTGIRGITENPCVLRHQFLPLQDFYTFSLRVVRRLPVITNVQRLRLKLEICLLIIMQDFQIHLHVSRTFFKFINEVKLLSHSYTFILQVMKISPDRIQKKGTCTCKNCTLTRTRTR